MNFQITDQGIINELEDCKIEEFTIGSHLFKLNDQNSDVDKVVIFAHNSRMENSFLWHHHNIQSASPECDIMYS